jgi:hypothetical protein
MIFYTDLYELRGAIVDKEFLVQRESLSHLADLIFLQSFLELVHEAIQISIGLNLWKVPLNFARSKPAMNSFK